MRFLQKANLTQGDWYPGIRVAGPLLFCVAMGGCYVLKTGQQVVRWHLLGAPESRELSGSFALGPFVDYHWSCGDLAAITFPPSPVQEGTCASGSTQGNIWKCWGGSNITFGNLKQDILLPDPKLATLCMILTVSSHHLGYCPLTYVT